MDTVSQQMWSTYLMYNNINVYVESKCKDKLMQVTLNITQWCLFFLFTTTHDILPQNALNKAWHGIRGWLCIPNLILQSTPQAYCPYNVICQEHNELQVKLLQPLWGICRKIQKLQTIHQRINSQTICIIQGINSMVLELNAQWELQKTRI